MSEPPDPHSSSRATHRRILKNVVLVGAFMLVAKGAGAGKEMLVAWRYGTSATVDAYQFVFAFATWLPTVWGRVSSYVFVPLATRLDAAARQRFNGEFLSVLLSVTVLASALLVLGAVPLGRAVDALLEGQPDGAGGAGHAMLVLGLSPLLLLGVWVAQSNAQLLAENRHANTLAGAIPALTLAGLLLVWPGAFDLWPLVLGTLAGYALQSIVLGAAVARSEHASRPLWPPRSEAWQGLGATLGIMALSQLIVSTVNLVDTVLAARLGEGDVATLGYATRLLSLALALGATAVGRALLPVLSAANGNPGTEAGAAPDAGAGTKADAGTTPVALAMRWAALTFVAGSVLAVPGWWLAQPAVALVFERGAFGPEDTERVAHVLRFGLTQMPFYFAGIVLVQLFAAMRAYRVLLGSSIVALLAKLVFGTLLSMRYDVAGIALSSAVMYAATFVWLALALVRHCARPPGRTR